MICERCKYFKSTAFPLAFGECKKNELIYKETVKKAREDCNRKNREVFMFEYYLKCDSFKYDYKKSKFITHSERLSDEINRKDRKYIMKYISDFL